MKKERKSILEFLKGLFRKEAGDSLTELPAAPTEETVSRLVGRTLGEKHTTGSSSPADNDGYGSTDDVTDGDGSDGERAGKATGDTGGADGDGPKKESCPYATKRAIVESIAEIRRFADEHKLAASVLRSLLALLGEIALGTLKGKVSRQILELLLKAINYEFAVEEAFRKGLDDGLVKGHEAGRKEGHEAGRKEGHEAGRKEGHEEGRKAWIEERFPKDDDGLPHINGCLYHPDTTSIFDIAADASR